MPPLAPTAVTALERTKIFVHIHIFPIHSSRSIALIVDTFHTVTKLSLSDKLVTFTNLVQYLCTQILNFPMSLRNKTIFLARHLNTKLPIYPQSYNELEDLG